MRPHALLTLALIAGASLAGCVGAGAVAQARDNFDVARDRGLAWDEGAVLVGIVGLEVSNVENATREVETDLADDEVPEESRDTILALFRALVADGDSKVGDGFAPAWGHLFVAKSGLHAVVIDASGATTFDDDFNLPGDDELTHDGLPLTGLDGTWAIDSEEAVRIARQHNPTYAALAGLPAATSSMSLGIGEDGPTWNLFMAASEASGAWVQVDATTGTVLGSWPRDVVVPPTPEPGEPVVDLPPQEGDEVRGSLTAGIDEAHERSFEVLHDGHRDMRLVLEATSTVGITDLRATVTDPAGNEHDLQVGGLGVFTTRQDGRDVQAMQGTWELAVSLGSSARETYSFSWCTDGTDDLDQYGDNVACQQLDTGDGDQPRRAGWWGAFTWA